MGKNICVETTYRVYLTPEADIALNRLLTHYGRVPMQRGKPLFKVAKEEIVQYVENLIQEAFEEGRK